MKHYKNILFISLFSFTLMSCKKYLDEVPNAKLTIPRTLGDFQQLLDNETVMTQSVYPGIGDMGSDDLFFTFAGWQSQSLDYVKNSYTWEKEIFLGQTSLDWNNGYKIIYYANIVLEGLEKIGINSNNQAEYNRIKGSALFFRALAHYDLEEIFGQPYRPSSIIQDLGIPLRLNTNLTEKAVRSTVKNVYEQIEADLLQAKEFLPNSTDFRAANRPTQVVILALLARINLTKQDYQKALEYSDNAIQLYGTLVDFNTLNLAARYPFVTRIEEVMFDCSGERGSIDIWIADSSLYQTYDNNDLRRNGFFRTSLGRLAFKGYYTKNGPFTFTGFATDELYLIRSECNARLGNINLAMADLNALLEKRWRTGFFVPVTAPTAQEALTTILLERRKELLFRGLRWTDLRRLNQDPTTAITLTRNLNGQLYSLAPNDPKYTYPIPPDEIVLSGIQQNLR